MPDLMPFVTIIDPQNRVPLKQPKDPKGGLLQPKTTRPLSDGSYAFKSQGFIFLNSIKDDMKKFIDKFLDDEE